MGYDVVTVALVCGLASACIDGAAGGTVAGVGTRTRQQTVVPFASRCRMGAPPPVSIRLPRPLIEFLDQEAEESFRSRNAVIKELIAKAYNDKKGSRKL